MDQDEQDELEDELRDPALVDAIMGWDGDRCECTECDCPRFIDEAGEERCRECRAGRHWPPVEGAPPSTG